MDIDIESLQKRIDEIDSQLGWMYEELQELESERIELEDYKSTLINQKMAEGE